ncbi:FHA domain-containing protein [Pseudorhodoferax sp. Leaf267]|uniref:FHA domain-containing protein n=1 Tax=Pseudorhodoferax sp. Leaf267 TaxID=1736316 RepID=UPI0006FAA808|nr:FHA domain-containing protein [Pseudorhodoferax sp. Leaf267]KQP23252.1 hypothetical protein ASF43_05110 [Pseudorhodoferax sp. Leaf267]
MQHLQIRIEQPHGPGASAVFGPKGGTIGRAENNTLVLSDAERSVSRLHARVEWRGGAFLLVNMGINPVGCNNTVLSTAEAATLASGDTVRIGSFTLRVQAVDADAEPVTLAPGQGDEALFDDMTGLPLRAAWASDFAMFHDSAGAKLAGTEQGWLQSLLHGMGCEVPPTSVPPSAEQAGALMRQAMNDTMRTWMAHCSPAVQQAWFSNFEDAFLKACLAAAASAAGTTQPKR